MGGYLEVVLPFVAVYAQVIESARHCNALGIQLLLGNSVILLRCGIPAASANSAPHT